MSNARPSRLRTRRPVGDFVIVASRFNDHYVQGLLAHAQQEFKATAPESVVTIVRVPGAFEIPVIVREIALQKRAAAIVAMGVILQGKTAHAEHLARAVTDALQRIALEHGVPVIQCVLSLETEAQARQRCLEDKMNRGTEAARAATEIAVVVADLRAKE